MTAGVENGLKSMGVYNVNIVYADLDGLVVYYDKDEENIKMTGKEGFCMPSFKLDKDFENKGLIAVPHREHPKDILGSSIYITSDEPDPDSDMGMVKDILSKYVNADKVEYVPLE
jgi:hypothetical protein